MDSIIFFILLALASQIVIFLVMRKRKKQDENSIIFKYNIQSAADAFRLLNDPHVPEADRIEIEKFYQGEMK